ncbi:MAG: GNAT family N-acetyltransferase [Bacteroidota bacterium]
MNDSSIRYLSNKDIDKTKWDACIDTAGNGLIYAYSFYLDHMARNWDALLLNDYEAVMPLTWNRKFGIRYLYQPFLAAQLGVFGRHTDGELVDRFIHAIPTSFRLVEISLNSANHPGSSKRSYRQRSNYLLSLNKPYDELYANYSENIRRNIKKAQQAGCIMEKGFDAEKVIGLAVAQMKRYDKRSANHVDRFRKLYQCLQEKKMAATYGISLNNELLATSVFFFSHHRAYYILVGNHPNGRALGASHALVDAFIKDHAGTNLLLDFEGSDLRSLASFYSSLGAVNEGYPALRINRLPLFLRWMKS